MDYAYGGGPLLLSVGILADTALLQLETSSPQEVAQHLDQTFCSRDKCHMGGFSARDGRAGCRELENMSHATGIISAGGASSLPPVMSSK